MRRILVIDTSILCLWLNVPGMDPCGPAHDQWDKQRIEKKIAEEQSNCATFVSPLATLIETGNHIARSKYDRKKCGLLLAELMRQSAKAETPWAAFSDQHSLWTNKKLIELADAWPDMAAGRLSLGDATIMDVAHYYAQAGYQVEILTGDQGLKACEPVKPIPLPRRRRR